MNPNHLDKPDRYLWNFGRFYKIDELRGRNHKNHLLYNQIRNKFITSLELDVPKKSGQMSIIDDNFEQFKDYVSSIYGKSKIKHCDKTIHGFKRSGKVLAKCLLDWKINRNENGRYYCDICNSWHLTSKAYE